MQLDNVEDLYPLSPLQHGMLFHSIASPRSGVYLEQFSFAVEAEGFDAAAFRSAWIEVLARHTALRTSFVWEGLDEPLQVVREKVDLPWQYLDWRGLDNGRQADALEGRLRSNLKEGFDLSQAPLMRVCLIRIRDDKYLCVWTRHHIVADGWSTSLILDELQRIYVRIVAGIDTVSPRVRPYRNYIAWLRQRDLEQTDDERFWREYLQGFSERTSPGTGGKRSSIHRLGDFSEIEKSFSSERTQALQATARAQRVTLNTLVQAAWAILVNRYTDSDDVIFGVTMSGRPPDLPGVQSMVGMCINTLPVRVRFDDDETLFECLKRLQTNLLDIRQRECSSLVKVQQWSEMQPGEPLFDNVVVFVNYPEQAQLDVHERGLRFGKLKYMEQSNYPLALIVVPQQSLSTILIYDTDVYSHEQIVRMLDQLHSLLESMSGHMNSRPRDVPFLIDAERDWILAQGWGPAREVPENSCIHDIIGDRADKQKNDVKAVACGDGYLTYDELRRRAALRTSQFRDAEIGAGSVVAVCLGRETELVVSVLAVLRAGAAYVILDPTYPAARLQQIMKHSGASFLVANQETIELFQGVDVPTLVTDVSRYDEIGPVGSKPRATIDVSIDQPAYIMYTSGSTGSPKGVIVSHRNLTYSTLARRFEYELEPAVFLLLSSLAFDSSVAGLYWTLVSGGTLVVPGARIEQDMDRLIECIEKHAVTHTLCLPSLYRLLLEHAERTASSDKLRSLRVVICAGEVIPGGEMPDTHRRLLPHARLYNEYGPTEATVWSTVYEATHYESPDPVPIGKPICNSCVYILDSHRNLAPRGAPGEIYIGGAGVAQGYLNDPAATRMKFVDVELGQDCRALNSSRLYRTGDFGRYREDGNIEFLGRIDGQVKIRGFRIEPAEIEAALTSHPLVEEAAVAATGRKRRPTGQASGVESRQLVAFIKSPSLDESHEAPVAELRSYVGNKLPDHMVPADIVAVPDLPRLPNGKIDRNALASLTWSRTKSPRDESASPRSEAEEMLTGIWSDVLNIETIGVDDNFFHLGGDSILSIQVISRVGQAGYRLSPNDLFDSPTIEKLALRLRPRGEHRTVLEPANEIEEAPLTPIQRWFFELSMTHPEQWNQSRAFEVDSAVSDADLESALQVLVDAHDALRTSFSEVDGRLLQRWRRGVKISVQHVDIPQREVLERRVSEVGRDLQSGFELSQAPLVRFVLFEQNDRRILLVIAHHLIIDAVSWNIFLEDLDTLCREVRRGEPLTLPNPTAAFGQWSLHQQALAGLPEITEDLHYWSEQLDPKGAGVPIDFGAEPNGRTGDSAPILQSSATTFCHGLEPSRTDQLMSGSVHNAYQTQVIDLLMSALAIVLLEWAGRPAVSVVFEGHGRHDPTEQLDISRTLGWFTTLAPMRLSLDRTSEDRVHRNEYCIKSVKELLRRQRFGGMGYGLLRYHGNAAAQEDLSMQELPRILLNYLGNVDLAQGSSLFRPVEISIVGERHPSNFRSQWIDINTLVSEGELKINWTYDVNIHRQNTIEKLARNYAAVLIELVEHCLDSENSGYTPADFPDAGLDQETLDAFINDIA